MLFTVKRSSDLKKMCFLKADTIWNMSLQNKDLKNASFCTILVCLYKEINVQEQVDASTVHRIILINHLSSPDSGIIIALKEINNNYHQI